jgi:uncharacterized alpha/beta hydrolase family protein
MARALLLIIALLIIAAIVMVATGFVSLTQTQNAQAPAYKVDVKDVRVGTTTKQVEVPTVTLENSSAAATNTAN